MPLRHRDLLLLAAFGAALLFPALGARDLWNPDEARYAEVAREMAALDEWFVPHLNGEVYTQKPPLLFWLIALSARATGGWSPEVVGWAARLPSALAAIGATLLTFAMGRLLFGRRAAWLAAAAFLTCQKILWQGRFGQIDMLLTALVTLAVWFWLRGYTEERPGLYPFFFLFAGLATLAKGPVGLLPPLLSIIVFLLVAREPGELRRMRIGRGLLLWAAVVLAWLVPAGLQAGGSYLRAILFRQNLTRYADPWHHLQPPWYYLEVLPADFFPWAVLLPAALAVGWRLRRTEEERSRKGFLFALCWVVVTLVFFSLSPGKRTVYILTMYPGLALLVGYALDRLASGAAREVPGGRRWLVWPLGLLALVSLLAPGAAVLAARANARAMEPLGPALVPLVAAALGLFACGATAAWWLARAERVPAAAGALASGMGAMALVLFLFAVPRFDAVKSARPMAETLVARMAPGEEYAIYPRLDPPFLFYTRRTAVAITDATELRAFTRRPGRQWVLAERDDWAALEDPPPLVEVARDRDVRDGYLLLTEPPLPGPAAVAPIQRTRNPRRPLGGSQ